MIREVISVLGELSGILSEGIPGRGHVVLVSELPTTVQVVLKKVGYRRRDVSIVPAERTSLNSYGGDGMRAFSVVLDISTGKHSVTYGSWGGPNMFSRGNAVDTDDRSYVIPDNGAVILGMEGGGGPVSATVYVNPNVIKGFLPVSSDITDRERSILSIYRGYKASYRGEELGRMLVKQGEVDSLIQRGFLSRNKIGSVSITTIGKNAAG